MSTTATLRARSSVDDASVLPALFFLLLIAIGFHRTAESAETPARNACALLKTAEVAAVLPGAKAGKVDTTREKYGIAACEWDTAAHRAALQFWNNEGNTARQEAQGLILGVIDPLKPAASRNIRYETIPGLGEAAVAVIEKGDPQRGVLDDFAMLVVQKGDQMIVFVAPELAAIDRAKALAGLKALGQSSVARF